MAATCSAQRCRRLVRRCLAAATVPRSELCSESIVWHEGSAGSASQDGGEAAVRAAELSCRAGAGRGRGHPGPAVEQQVSRSLLLGE